MTVNELIKELNKYPQNMPVVSCMDIHYPPETCKIEISQRTWVDTNILMTIQILNM